MVGQRSQFVALQDHRQDQLTFQQRQIGVDSRFVDGSAATGVIPKCGVTVNHQLQGGGELGRRRHGAVALAGQLPERQGTAKCLLQEHCRIGQVGQVAKGRVASADHAIHFLAHSLLKSWLLSQKMKRPHQGMGNNLGASAEPGYGFVWRPRQRCVKEHIDVQAARRWCSS